MKLKTLSWSIHIVSFMIGCPSSWLMSLEEVTTLKADTECKFTTELKSYLLYLTSQLCYEWSSLPNSSHPQKLKLNYRIGMTKWKGQNLSFIIRVWNVIFFTIKFSLYSIILFPFNIVYSPDELTLVHSLAAPRVGRPHWVGWVGCRPVVGTKGVQSNEKWSSSDKTWKVNKSLTKIPIALPCQPPTVCVSQRSYTI
jgi:hypothetical protein